MNQSEILSTTKSIKSSEAAAQCLAAVQEVTSAIQTSYGALGLDKICIDESGEILITNDGATILNNMKVTHPISMLVAELAKSQDKDEGDGTTGVVLLATELIKNGIKIIDQGVCPATVVKGYMLAYSECVRAIDGELCTEIVVGDDLLEFVDKKYKHSPDLKDLSNGVAENNTKPDDTMKGIGDKTDELGSSSALSFSCSNKMKPLVTAPEVQHYNTLEKMSCNKDTVHTLSQIINTTLSSKVIQGESDLFTSIILNSILRIRQPNAPSHSKSTHSKYKYPIGNINILKKQGKSINESQFYPGILINCKVASPTTMPTLLLNPKVALLGFGLKKKRLPLGTKIIIKNPDNLEEIRKKEDEICIQQTMCLLNAGANIIICDQGIEDSCIKLISKSGGVAIKFVRRVDIERISLGLSVPILTVSDLDVESDTSIVDTEHNLSSDENENNKLTSKLGNAASFRVIDVSATQICLLSFPSISSILLRGPNEALLDETERSLHDALSTTKSVLECGKILPGGGATEVALSIRLDKLASETYSRESMCISEFAKSLLGLVKVLARNGGLDGNSVIMEIIKAQTNISNKDEQEDFSNKDIGFDLYTGDIQNNISAGIVEPNSIKLSALRSAVEAAISVLRVRSVIEVFSKEEKANDGDQCGDH
ncbi:T-complex protein 1 subunit alpha [Cucumispora dikerogammari]|nr:T-complex protein 1 subunit alpha [Cucumispora dikerogammari]